MSETPMNKLRELCEKWEREAIGNGEDIYDDGDLRRCAYELRAILPDVERLVEALRGIQHACESHSGASKFDIGNVAERAIALFAQPVAPKETK